MKKVIPNSILLGEAMNLLDRGVEVIMMTKGNSMLPFIRGEKDSVRLKKLEKVSERDVVLARITPERYVLHRIVSIDGDIVTLMGDGNLYGIEKCKLEDIAGTVVEIVPPSGRSKAVPDGHIWDKLMPVRRYLLWLIRLFK